MSGAPRVLLAWECGASPDHAERLAVLGGWFRDRGWQPVVALKDLSALALPDGFRVVQAPVWPQELARAAWALAPGTVHPASGLPGMGAALGPVLSAWETLFDVFAPALVVADGAPGAVLAAHGRAPCVTLWGGAEPALAPGDMERINAVLPPDRAIAGAEALMGDHALTFALPGFAGGPGTAVLPVGVAGTPLAPALSDAVHVHLSVEASQSDVLVAAVIRMPGQRSIWAPGLPGEVRVVLENAGVSVHSRAPDARALGAAASLVVHAGGTAFAQQILFAGLAQVVLSSEPDLARIGQRLEEMGAGQHIALPRLTLPLLVDLCTDTARRRDMAQAARAEAERLRALDLQDWPDAIADVLAQIGPETRLT